jgi:hypothetical protein
MSAQEIIAELPDLTRPELEELDAHQHELLCRNHATSSKSWGEALLEVAGTAPAPSASGQYHRGGGLPACQ